MNRTEKIPLTTLSLSILIAVGAAAAPHALAADQIGNQSLGAPQQLLPAFSSASGSTLNCVRTG